MKNNKINQLLIFIFILPLVLILLGTTSIPNKQDDQNLTPLSTINPFVHDWNRTWGGSDRDIGYAMALDSSENIYVAGHTSSFGAGNYDMCLVKYNSLGVQQWNRTWHGGGEDYCLAITLDSSNNIYLAGETEPFGAGNYEISLVKLVEGPPETSESPEMILGYDLIILTGGVCIISVLLIKKRDKTYK